MPVLDFSTLSNSELQAYFHEGSLTHDAGYDNYELEFLYQDGNHFKQKVQDFFSNEGIVGAVDVLELGGARGHRAVYALNNWPVFKSWEIVDIYDSPLKQTHPKLTYTIGDARVLLNDSKVFRNNSKVVTASFRFLECIPEPDLPNLISNLNRITRQNQYHIVTQGANPNYYSTRDLIWWSEQGFESGTVFISYSDFQHGNFSNIVRVP